MAKTLSTSWRLRAKAEIERRRRKEEQPAGFSDIDSWEKWLNKLYPAYVSKTFANRHKDLWEWIERLQTGIRQEPFVAIWPRGGAKSTTAELACVRVGFKKTRQYIWYISSTQEKADQHVETIAALLESAELEHRAPKLSSRRVGKYGNSKGWRRWRLRTASGLTIDARGLDVGSRGAKEENRRPDLMIFDDVDEKHDTLAIVKKKIETITTSLLPAGSSDLAVLFIQNLIHTNSIAAQLVDKRADFMADRMVSGPFPAIDGLTYEQRDGLFFITGGTPSWEGQNLEICQNQINTWGLSAFLQEAQHQVEQKGGIWDHVDFRHCKWNEVPWRSIVRVTVWVDPAVTSTDESDCMGIQADAIAEDGTIYRLFSWESITSPEDALERAILKAIELGSRTVGVETDNGGETWKSVYEQACQHLRAKPQLKEVGVMTDFPEFTWDKAGAGYGSKVERNARMLTDYERGRVVHVEGTHETLERALYRFPLKPLDLADAAFWAWHDLRGDEENGGFSMQYASTRMR